MNRQMWRTRGVVPFLAVAFLNAFTDLGHKIIIQNAIFKFYEGPKQMALTAIVNALILLPFILTFTPAGFLADKFPKNRIIMGTSFLSIPITLLITLCYGKGAFWPAFFLTFVLALQSALYSPAKFGYIKELLGKEKLAAANGMVQAVTITAILSGVFFYSVLFERLFPSHFSSLGNILTVVQPLGWFLVAGAVLETVLTMTLPVRRKTDTSLHFSPSRYVKGGYLAANLKMIWAGPTIRLSIIGLGIFWAVNQVILASFPAYLKSITGEMNTIVAQGIMAMAGLGVIAGSVLAGRVSRNFIETGIIPLGAVGMSLCLLALPMLPYRIWLGAACLAYGFFGGLFVVPLNSLIQFHAGRKDLGKVLAGSNFIQNLFMLLFLGLSAGFAAAAFSPRKVFFVLACITLAGTFYTVYKIPQSLIRYMVRIILLQRYQLNVQGMAHIPSSGGALLLGNHTSFLDWAVLQMACPRAIRFVMHRDYYDRWYVRWLLDIFKVIPITSGGGAGALRQVREALGKGRVVAIFPEGHISRNGQLGEFHTGFEQAAADTGACIIPFYIRGLWGSRLSPAADKLKQITRHSGPRTLSVSFGQPLPDSAGAVEVKQAVLKASIHAWKEYSESLPAIPAAWLRTARKSSGRKCLYDAAGAVLTNGKLIAAALGFSRSLAGATASQQNIGLLVPPSAGGIIANLAVLFRGKTVVNLNYTAEPQVLRRCAEKAGIKTLITSRLFAKKLEERGLDMSPLFEGCRVIFMEDVKAKLSRSAMLGYFLMGRLLPVYLLEAIFIKKVPAQSTAAILFSSGSEGTPKGVQLSHTNIMGNLKQTASVINPVSDDIMLCTLPLFHAFGLTITTFLPLVEGIPLVCQPDPTDARTVGRLVSEHQVTILCGTSTFLRLYARHPKVLPLMFQPLRLVVAGAERLQEEVRKDFKEKFGKDVIEGYGATETTPVAGVNVPDVLLSPKGSLQVGNKSGTVGLPLPGTTFKIVDPESLMPLPVGDPGLVLIGGTQIMQGYLGDAEKTGEVIVEQEGIRWYKSGDRGKIDKDGFLTILDRFSRFAKIGGEMISLSAVEMKITAILNDSESEILAVNLPDPAKGEKIVLLHAGEAPREKIEACISTGNIPPLMKPKNVFQVSEIPKLGTGKSDFSKAKKLAAVLADARQ